MTFCLVSCLAAHSCQARCFCLFCASSGLLLLPWPVSKAEEIERSVWVFMYGCSRRPSWEAKGFFCWLCLIRRAFSIDSGSSDRTRGWMPLWRDPLCCSGVGELLWGDWFYQRLFHGWHIFSARREHQLPTSMQAQAQPPPLAGMGAGQGVGGQQTKALFCYARYPASLEEGEYCGQKGCLHPHSSIWSPYGPCSIAACRGEELEKWKKRLWEEKHSWGIWSDLTPDSHMQEALAMALGHIPRFLKAFLLRTRSVCMRWPHLWMYWESYA